mgnify:CR=1 FL=1
MTLEEMKNVDPRTVDRSTLRQRKDVRVKKSGTPPERILDYISQIGNPYCYLEGKTVVKLSFADTNRTLEDCVREYLSGV